MNMTADEVMARLGPPDEKDPSTRPDGLPGGERWRYVTRESTAYRVMLCVFLFSIVLTLPSLGMIWGLEVWHLEIEFGANGRVLRVYVGTTPTL